MKDDKLSQMKLRSGRITGDKIMMYQLRQVAKSLMKLKNASSSSTSIDASHCAKTYGWYQASVNEKIDAAPEILKKNCDFCLRQIIEESVLRGINIKFENKN